MLAALVRRSAVTAFALACLSLAFHACTDTPTELLPPTGLQVVSGPGADATAACSPVVSIPLLADGGAFQVGSVRIANDEADVFVTFETTDGWEITASHLFVGDEGDRIPTTGGGTPQVGRFPWAGNHVGGTTSYTYAVSRADFDDTDLLTVAAHADVQRGEEMEGAWADGEPIGSGRSWATKFDYAPVACASELVTVADGGTVILDAPLGPVQLSVPPGAVSSDVQITVEVVDASTLSLPGTASASASPSSEGPATAAQLGSVVVMGDYAYDFGPEGLEFNEPVPLTLPYDDQALPQGASEEDVQIFVINGIFLDFPSTVDVVANTVSAQIEHFSNYFPGVDTAVEADLAITQLLEPTGPFEVGQAIEYGAQVENLGPDDVPGATFTWTAFGDVILEGVFSVACSEADGSVISADVVVICDLDAITAGAERGIPVLRVIPQSEGDVEIWGRVGTPDGVTDPVPDNDRQERIVSVGPPIGLEADLAITQLLEPTGPFEVGQAIEYGAQVENLGPDDVPGATFTWTAFGDVILEGVFSVACSEADGSVISADVVVICDLDAITAGAERGIPVLRVIPQSEGDVEIWGRVGTPDGVTDPVPDNDRQERIVSVGPPVGLEADLAVTRLSEPTGPFKVGQVIEYGADVENLGPDDVPGATFTWTGFGDLTLEDVFGLCAEIPNPAVGTVAVSCPLDAIAAGALRGIPVFRIIPQSTNAVTVWGTVTAPEGVNDPNSGNNRQERTPTIDPLVADVFLSLIDDSPDPVAEGEVVRYRVYAQSGGTDDDLPRVLVDMKVDGDAELVSMPTGLGVSCTDFSSTSPSAVDVRCEVAPLQAGIASPPLDLEVRALSGPSLQAEAEIIPIASISTDPDPSDNIQSETTTVSPPPSGATAYVAVSGTNQVQAVSAATNTVIATMATGSGPYGMDVRPGTDELWVTNRTGETITRISTTSNTVIGTIPTQQLLRGDLFDVAFSPDGGTAYVTVNTTVSNAARVVILNAATGAQITDIRLAQDNPKEIRVLPDGSKAYVTTNDGVTVLDLTTNTVAASIAVTGSAAGLDIAPDGSAVYFTENAGTFGVLREIDPTTDALVGAGLPVGSEPNGVAVSPDGSKAYVANRAFVVIVDLITETQVTISTGVGTGPQSVDVTSDGALLFVTDRDGGQVLKIDLATQAITPTAVGSFPAEVVIRN